MKESLGNINVLDLEFLKSNDSQTFKDFFKFEEIKLNIKKIYRESADLLQGK